MIKFPYDSAALSVYVKMDKIRFDLKMLFKREGYGGQLRQCQAPNGAGSPRVFMLLPGPADIGVFGHPLDVDFYDTPEDPVLVIDVRNFAKSLPTGELKITSELDFATLRNRAFANFIYTKEPTDLMSIGSMPMAVYIRWISDAIGSRLALPPETQVRLMILVGYFYCSQYIDFGGSLDERERIKVAQLINKALHIPVDTCLKVLDDIDDKELPGASVYGLLRILNQYGDSVRYEQLNMALFYSILYTGSWFGSNKNEIIALAVEHPPTFIGMFLAACEERGYRKTILGELIKNNDKNGIAANTVKIFWSQPAIN